LNDIRIRFTRGEQVKYISHLDLMKVFERAVRRARLPIAYSQGFNPHPLMVFGLPLQVGVTSEAEFADIELSEPFEPGEFSRRLNAELPEGIRVTGAKPKFSKKNVMASIILSSYRIVVYVPGTIDFSGLKRKLDDFMANESILVMKEGKNGAREIDIRPMIHRLHILEIIMNKDIIRDEYNPERVFAVSALLSAGNTVNLKPTLFMCALSEKTGLELETVGIHRTGLYAGEDGIVLDPLDDAAVSE